MCRCPALQLRFNPGASLVGLARVGVELEGAIAVAEGGFGSLEPEQELATPCRTEGQLMTTSLLYISAEAHPKAIASKARRFSANVA